MYDLETDTYLLYGNITDEDISKVRLILGSDDVYEAKKKAPGSHPHINLAVIVFIRYSIIDYEIDVSLIDLLEPERAKLYKVIDYFSQAGRNDGYICADLYISHNNKLFSLLLVARSEDYDMTVMLADKEMSNICKQARSLGHVKVNISKEEKLEIHDYTEIADLYTVFQKML